MQPCQGYSIFGSADPKTPERTSTLAAAGQRIAPNAVVPASLRLSPADVAHQLTFVVSVEGGVRGPWRRLQLDGPQDDVYVETEPADRLASPLATLRSSVYRRLLVLPIVAYALVVSGCSSSGARSAVRVSSPSGSAEATASVSASAASALGSIPGSDADLDRNGKVDLAKFLAPSSTHVPKDVDCVVLFGSGSALERATSFAAEAMGAQYTLESYDELRASWMFSPLTSNGPGQCVYGLAQRGRGPEGEVIIGVTRAGGHMPSVENDSVLPLFAARSIVRDGVMVSVQTTASAQTDFIHTGQYFPAPAATVQRLTDYVISAALAHLS